MEEEFKLKDKNNYRRVMIVNLRMVTLKLNFQEVLLKKNKKNKMLKKDNK